MKAIRERSGVVRSCARAIRAYHLDASCPGPDCLSSLCFRLIHIE